MAKIERRNPLAESKELQEMHEFVKLGNLSCNENEDLDIDDYVSMAHFTNKIKSLLRTVNTMYYDGYGDTCDGYMYKIGEVLKNARIFNKHVGL